MLEDNENFKIVNAAFPRIGAKLKFAWGKPECLELFHELLHDTRQPPRSGFAFDVFMALDALENEHNVLFPSFIAKDRSTWGYSPN